MPRLISADVIDDSTDDWAISDEGKGSGAQRGPITTWPAPILRHDDRNPLLPFKSMGLNRRRGQLDAYDFLREKVTSTNLFGESRGDEVSDCPPSRGHTTDGFDSFSQNIDASGCCDAGMLYSYRDLVARTDAGALDAYCDAGSIYDNISSTHHQILAVLKKAGKLTPTANKQLQKAFESVMAHATDNSKWDAFNTAKNLSFQFFGGPSSDIDRIFKALQGTMPTGGGGVFGAIGSAVSSVGSGVASVGKGAFSIAKGIATPVAGLITSPVKLASDIAQGKNILDSVKNTVTRDIKNIKGVAPYAQAVLSFVPGVGQGVNAAIAAGSALANGQPITSALVSGLKNAIPGGPVASQAFDTAYQVARGANVGDAALALAREQIPGGPAAKAAFDAGIAVAKGQNLQQAAVGVVKGAAVQLVPGNNDIVKSAVSDIASGQNVLQTAMKAGTSAMATFNPLSNGPFSSLGPRMKNTVATQNLTKLLPEDVNKVANAVLKNASLRSLSVKDLAAKLNVPQHIAREGVASVLQSVARSGGASVPHLAPAQKLANRIPMTVSFDQGMARFASKMSPISFSHNSRIPPFSFRPRGAQGFLDAGEIDPTTLPVLRQGSSGPFVVQWQKILGTSADGKFGPQTTSLTRTFQGLKGLTVDGVVGPKTWAAGLLSIATPIGKPTITPTIPLPGTPPAVSTQISNAMPTIRQGSTGTAVRTWQAIVGVPVDGQFGPQTATATRNWQSKNGLVADGVVGPKTWTKALAGGATTIPLPPPPVTTLPPISVPPISIPVPEGPPIVFPPTTTPPVITTTTPIPGGPVITTTTPPGGGPIVVSQPPITEPPKKAAGAGVAIAVGLGLLYFVAKGSGGKLF